MWFQFDSLFSDYNKLHESMLLKTNLRHADQDSNLSDSNPRQQLRKNRHGKSIVQKGWTVRIRNSYLAKKGIEGFETCNKTNVFSC